MTELKSPEPDCPEDFFKRDFPSLKEKVFIVMQDKVVRANSYIWLSIDEEVVPTSSIQKHTRDIQRIIEAVSEVCKDTKTNLIRNMILRELKIENTNIVATP